jgi:hypothetical protein
VRNVGTLVWLLLCLALCGCYLQPTVFDGGTRIPQPAPIEAAPPPDDPVGCVTHVRGGRRHVGSWSLDRKRSNVDEVERAMIAFSPSAADATRARRDGRLLVGLFAAGLGLVAGSIIGAVAWAEVDHSRRPVTMMAPSLGGLTLAIAGIAVGARGDHAQRRAIDTFNHAAADQDRCPPESGQR